jgi:hypothetical protein
MADAMGDVVTDDVEDASIIPNAAHEDVAQRFSRDMLA